MSKSTDEKENSVQCQHKPGEDWTDGCCKSQRSGSVSQTAEVKGENLDSTKPAANTPT